MILETHDWRFTVACYEVKRAHRIMKIPKENGNPFAFGMVLLIDLLGYVTLHNQQNYGTFNSLSARSSRLIVFIGFACR